MGAPAGIATDRIVWCPGRGHGRGGERDPADARPRDRRARRPAAPKPGPGLVLARGGRRPRAARSTSPLRRGRRRLRRAAARALVHRRAGSTSRSAASSAGRARARAPGGARLARPSAARAPRLDYGELNRMADGVAAALAGSGSSRGETVGVFMPLAPQTVGDALRLLEAGRDRGADLLRLRRRGGRPAADRFRGPGPGHRRRLRPPRLGGGDEVGRRRGARRRDRGRAGRWSGAEAAPTIAWDDGRDVDWDDVVPRRPRAGDRLAARRPSGAADLHQRQHRAAEGRRAHPRRPARSTSPRTPPTTSTSAPDDRLCWVTDIGWIMGAWEIVAAGATGASVCLVEGAPATPRDRLWRLIGDESISVVGVSPSLIRGLAAAGAAPGPEHDLSLAADPRRHRRALEPGRLRLADGRGRRRALSDHQHLRRLGGRRLLPRPDRRSRSWRAARSAARRSGWTWRSSTTTASRSARRSSASSSAGARGRG